HNVVSPLRPDDVLHSHTECLRHFLEGICPLWGVLGIADSLLSELRQHDISYHGRPPWLGPCATLHEEACLSLPQQSRHSHRLDRSSVSGRDVSCRAVTIATRG